MRAEVRLEISDAAFINGFEGGEFKPEKFITRAEMATILARITGHVADISNVSSFEDVAKDYWAAEAIAKASSIGLINGYDNGTFKPEQPVTRAEMAELAMRIHGSEAAPGAGFSDTIGNWAESSIRAAQGAGYIQGYLDGTFRPEQELTRAEAVVILNRAIDRKPISGEFNSMWVDVPNNYWAARDLAAASKSLDKVKHE